MIAQVYDIVLIRQHKYTSEWIGASSVLVSDNMKHEKAGKREKSIKERREGSFTNAQNYKMMFLFDCFRGIQKC